MLSIPKYNNATIPSSSFATQEAASFVAAATEYYHQQNPNFKSYNQTEVWNCIAPWSITANKMVQLAQLQAKNQNPEQSLVFFDQYNATTIEEAKQHLLNARGCAMEAIGIWGRSILLGLSPEDAYSSTLKQIDERFAKGDCGPPNKAEKVILVN
eukprot:TRINITY_DN9230_c0_g1_i1.p2 TRINITY_DN9230_c0_g1~~TRINITY_DN9230_c0_g1_i1.p2  ORF type:complete len:155 (-),score=58.85 TRINITY_DN9230_c0_g1_i1:31-495(-)